MSKKPDMIPALPILEEFQGSINETIEFNNAIKRPDFIYATTFREQIGIICEHIHNDFYKVSYERIGKIFHENKFAVRHQHYKYLYGKGQQGRPSKLNEEQITKVIQKIYSYHTNPGFSIYPGFDDIEEFIFSEFNIQIKRNTLRHILNLKLSHLFKTVIGKPMDSKRVQCNPISIDLNLNTLSELIVGVPINFIFNIDEVGQQDFADAELKTLIAPADYNQLYAYYPVTRVSNRSSAIAAISPVGLVCQPQLAVTRATLDDELYEYLPLDSIQIVHTDNRYVNTNSFEHWFKTQFLTSLHNLRQKYQYNGKAIVIMDGLKAHYNLIEKIDCQNENIIFHFLVAHSSDQTQPLDLGIFGVMKHFEQNFQNIKQLSRQTNQIIKVIKCLYQASTPPNCKAAFKAAGITGKITNQNGNFIEFSQFDLTNCIKVRHYSRAYINELAQNRIPLTINQQMIFRRITQQESQKAKNRIPLTYFPNK